MYITIYRIFELIFEKKKLDNVYLMYYLIFAVIIKMNVQKGKKTLIDVHILNVANTSSLIFLMFVL